MSLKYIVYLLLVLAHTFGEESKEKYVFHVTDMMMSCSSRLSLAISNLCNGTYKIVKRDTSIILAKLGTRPKKEYETNKRWLAEERSRRLRRQIADECCKQPCTISKLIMYCPDDAKLVQEQPEIFYGSDEK